jgi:hypothetical protein
VASDPLPIMSSQMSYLWDALCTAYQYLFGAVAKGDNVFRDLVVARIVEPTSKVDSLRVIEEVGVAPASYATVKRRLPGYAQPSWRQTLSGACASHAGLGPASLVLYDVSTLYFGTDAGDGFGEPGFSKERRLEPQITLGRCNPIRRSPSQCPGTARSATSGGRWPINVSGVAPRVSTYSAW